jgi:hypothetical protein
MLRYTWLETIELDGETLYLPPSGGTTADGSIWDFDFLFETKTEAVNAALDFLGVEYYEQLPGNWVLNMVVTLPLKEDQMRAHFGNPALAKQLSLPFP